MPKLREPVDSLRDAQRHLTVFHSRALKASATHEVLTLTNEVIATIDKIINKLPQEPQEEKSFSDKAISSALDLINKEVKKDRPKIDLVALLKAMYNTTKTMDAVKIGLEHGITQEQIKNLIKKAPMNTPLGKLIAAKSAKLIQTSVVPAVIEPNGFEQDEEPITNDSEPDEELKQLLGTN
jgi:hypothetical protein